MVRKTRKSQSKKLSKVRLLNVSSFGIISLITISVFIGFSNIYNNNAFAESASVNASAKVLESCSVEASGNDHTATIVAGNYDQIGSDTIFNINCNDPNGYIIYAVGNSGDTEGNTNLISQTDKGDIVTGLNTSGDTSNWSFKLSNPTSNLTILPNYNDHSIIPNTRTAVVKREAGTTSPTVDSFHASYNAYISKTQPVDTYEGKVKYILFHPSTYLVPESCNDGEGVRLKDGKCWSKTDVATSVQWENASSYCSGVWHLPSQAEFSTLIRAYYPTASANGTGYKYYFSGDASTFTNDWGATSDTWWSSTERSSTYAYRLFLDSSSISSDLYGVNKSYNYQIRCVSDDTEYNITYNLNSGSGVSSPQTAKADGNNVKLDSTTPTRSGYNFLGWCDKSTTSDTCSGTTYPAGANYPITNTADNTITLWAMWESAGPQNCGGTVRLADGKNWCKNDSSSSATWEQAKAICNQGNYHLPSLAEFNALVRAYFTPVYYDSNYGGYYYMGSTSTFASAWGATGGRWWSSTEYYPGSAYVLDLGSSVIDANHNADKTYSNQVRCVSS